MQEPNLTDTGLMYIISSAGAQRPLPHTESIRAGMLQALLLGLLGNQLLLSITFPWSILAGELNLTLFELWVIWSQEC